MQGPYTQAYLPMADLDLDFHHYFFANGYHRQLDLGRAVATTTYSVPSA